MKSVPNWIINKMFGSPNIQNRATDMSPLQASTAPFPTNDRIHLTLKKQRIADNAEAPKQMRITAEETIQPVDFSAGSNERESLQMTPKCFKSQSYLKVDRGSTGRKWGYLKASSESKKHLISLFNTGTTGPMPLVNSLEKDHNID